MRPLPFKEPEEPARKPPPKTFKVLAVDDDPLVRKSLSGILSGLGMEVSLAGSLREARDHLEQEEPDALVTDIMLGDGNGLVLLHWSSEKYPTLPVILVTGRPDTMHIPQAVRYRASDYVEKPVSPGSLRAALQRALDRKRLLEDLIQLQEMNEILCQVLARAVEAKDRFTAGHSQRVAVFAQTMARKAGLPEETSRKLKVAGQLHDIGKIGIDDQVLTAPRALTPEEREQIKAHPATAVEILRPLPRMEEVRRWIFEHHERWDGKGYPRGIQGEEISLPGRILILVEVFDALNTRRSYKEPWPLPRILDYYRQERGKHFDPDLCDFFLDGMSREGASFLGEMEQPGLIT